MLPNCCEKGVAEAVEAAGAVAPKPNPVEGLLAVAAEVVVVAAEETVEPTPKPKPVEGLEAAG